MDDYAALMHSFVESISASTAVWTWQPAEESWRVLSWAAAVLRSEVPAFEQPGHVRWFAEYGCALLATVACVGKVKMQLVSLDRWSFEMHSGKGRRTFTSRPGRDELSVIYIGTVDELKFEALCELMARLLADAQLRTGRKRSAASNEQGHQKTASFIDRLFKDALEGLDAYFEDPSADITESCTAPPGGFTDVGLHSGGRRRCTSWPLVRAVLQVVLEAKGHFDLYQQAMAELHLWMTERMVALLQPQAMAGMQNRSVFNTSANSAMQMLFETVREGSVLTNNGHAMTSFDARCCLVRFQLEEAINVRVDQAMQLPGHILPLLKRAEVHTREPKLSLPESKDPDHAAGDLDAARERAAANLGWLPAPPTTELFGVQMALSALSTWLDHPKLQPKQGDSVAAQLVLRSVEACVFGCFSSFIARTAEVFTCDLAGVVCVLIENILMKYRLVMNAFRKAPGAMMLAEVDSRELLMVWVSFCLVHKISAQAEPLLLGDYGIALDSRDLRHLVLSDATHVDAVIELVKYLHAHRDRPFIFSLRDRDSTMNFALRRAREDPLTMQVWQMEQANAQQRQIDHYDKILRKKRQLASLDVRLSSLKDDLATWESRRDGIPSPSWLTSSANDQKYQQAQNKVNELQSEINEVNEAIASEEAPPPPVLQPLPSREELALPILFFVKMPHHLQASHDMSLKLHTPVIILCVCPCDRFSHT